MATPKVLRDMRTDCSCEKADYCPLEAMLMSQRDYILEQHKLVEVFKYLMGEETKREVSWDEAYREYTDRGYAALFARVYTPEKTFRQLKKEMYENGISKRKNTLE